MKIGTILENNYTAKDNPLHYSIYLGIYNGKVKTMYCYDGKIRYALYYKSDVGKDKEIRPTKHIIPIADIINREIINAIEKDIYNKNL